MDVNSERRQLEWYWFLGESLGRRFMSGWLQFFGCSKSILDLDAVSQCVFFEFWMVINESDNKPMYFTVNCQIGTVLLCSTCSEWNENKKCSFFYYGIFEVFFFRIFLNFFFLHFFSFFTLFFCISFYLLFMRIYRRRWPFWTNFLEFEKKCRIDPFTSFLNSWP